MPSIGNARISQLHCGNVENYGYNLAMQCHGVTVSALAVAAGETMGVVSIIAVRRVVETVAHITAHNGNKRLFVRISAASTALRCFARTPPMDTRNLPCCTSPQGALSD